MKFDSLLRLLPLSYAITIVATFVFYLVGYPAGALGLLVGGVWSTSNFWVLYQLFYQSFFQKNPLLVFLWLQLKIPVLYGLGYIALKLLTIDYIFAIIGFHIPFMIFFVWGIWNNRKVAKTIHQD